MPSFKIGNNLKKITEKLFESEDERTRFQDCFESPNQKDQSLIWLKEATNFAPALQAFDFQPSWIQRIGSVSAGNNDLHSSGAFYILDTSSVFSIAPLLSLQKQNLIFDACASPGGKAIMAWKALSPDLLICNEFVEKRLKPLISNLQRCHIRPSEVFHLPNKIVGEMFPASFPLVLVDAPCSGQSLILKGEKADGAFHPQTINGNAMRQRRIMAEIAPAVAPGGHLLYMTCTFSKEENEEIIEWFVKKFPSFEVCSVPSLQSFQTKLSKLSCYRLWPQDNMGAGSFTALLKSTESGSTYELPKNYKPVWRAG